MIQVKDLQIFEDYKTKTFANLPDYKDTPTFQGFLIVDQDKQVTTQPALSRANQRSEKTKNAQEPTAISSKELLDASSLSGEKVYDTDGALLGRKVNDTDPSWSGQKVNNSNGFRSGRKVNETDPSADVSHGLACCLDGPCSAEVDNSAYIEAVQADVRK